MRTEQIKQSIDLADYIRSFGIELKAHGKNNLKGLCPFHDDHNPSLIITPSKKLFNCPVCNKGGSVIDFAMFHHNVDLKEAINILKDSPDSQNSQKSLITGHRLLDTALSPERSNQLLEKVLSFYEKTFADVPEGRDYLESRGITDVGLYSAHRIGYCNGTLTNILPRHGASSTKNCEIWSELKTLGILLDNNQVKDAPWRERFTGCIVVPVFDVEGSIVTLYARHSADGKKQHMFLPDRSKGLWNIASIKTYPEIILVESIIDALSLQMAGHHNVISIQGTNGFNNGQADLLSEHGVQNLIFLLDGDEVGRNTGKRLIAEKTTSFSNTVCTLPDSYDPNSYLTEYGPQKLAEFLAQSPVSNDPASVTKSVSATDNRSLKTDHLSDGFAITLGIRRYEIHGLKKDARHLKATIRIEHAGKLHVDTIDFHNARAQRSLAQDICRKFEQPAETIEADIQKLILACEQYDPDTHKKATEPDPVSQISAKNREEAEAFGKSSNLIDKILADYEKCGLVGEKHNKLLCYLAAISRKMDDPLSVLILSSSGSGKTALQDATLAFCPPENVVKLTSLSGKALFYKDEFSLKHKILALEEGDGAEDASYAIRNLISAGVLIIESTIKDFLTGRMTTMENRVEGPTVVFLTTTNPNTDSETKSRFWIISIDESREQTRAILSSQRRSQSLAGLSGNAHIDAIFTKHQNFQRLLKPLPIVNPYADCLGYSDDRLQGRRDQPKYLNLINAIALLRQMQKEVKTFIRRGELKTIDYIEVDLGDIALANELTSQILGKSLDELSAPARELLVTLDAYVEKCFHDLQDIDKENVPSRTRINFSRRDIRDFSGWSRTRVHTYLNELIEMEYVVHDSGKINSLQHYRLLYEGQGKDGAKFVPGLKSVEQIERDYDQDSSK